MTEETFDGAGEGQELALPGDLITKRHIATRASNKRKIVVLVTGDVEFEGYAIGLDEHSLQLLEIPSGDVSSISLSHIVAITDGDPFTKLTPEEKGIVDRRTASFRKTARAWLTSNWPKVYDREEDHARTTRSSPRAPYVKPPYVRYGRPVEDGEREGAAGADQEVWN